MPLGRLLEDCVILVLCALGKGGSKLNQAQGAATESAQKKTLFVLSVD